MVVNSLFSTLQLEIKRTRFLTHYVFEKLHISQDGGRSGKLIIKLNQLIYKKLNHGIITLNNNTQCVLVGWLQKK